MSEYAWAMLVYFALQGASLAFLPRWWKLAAVPALLLVPEIISERIKPGYMSDVIIAMAAIYACAYLALVWLAFGMTRLVQRCRHASGKGLPSRTKDNQVL